MSKQQLIAGIAGALAAGFGAAVLSTLQLKVAVGVIVVVALAAVLLVLPLAQRVLLFVLGSIIAFHIGTGLPPLLMHPGHIGLSEELTVQANDILVLALIIHGLVRWATQRVAFRLYAFTTIPALAWLVISALSATVATEVDVSLIQIGNMVELFMLYFVVANSIHDEADITWLVRGLLLGALFQGALGCYQWIAGHGAGFAFLGERSPLYYGRPGGTIGHPNGYALYLAAVLPVGIALLFCHAGRLYKVFVAFTLGVGTLGLVFSLSRGGWIGFGVAVILVFFYANRRRRQNLRMAFVGGASIFLFLLALAYSQRTIITARLTDSQATESALSRITMARAAFSLIQDHPVLGIGLNNYAVWMPSYDPIDFVREGGVVLIHNIYLLVAAETGLLGLLAFLWFLVSLFVRALGDVNRARGDITWLGAVGALSAVAALEVHGLGDYDILANDTVFRVLWLFAALIAGLSAFGVQGRDADDQASLRADHEYS